MTIVFKGNGHWIGLYTDTKVARPAGNTFFETDTGDTLVSDGTYWWLTSLPGPLSPRRWGTVPLGATGTVGVGMFHALSAATGIGTTTAVISDANGKYLNLPSGTTTGNRGGYRYNVNTAWARHHDPKFRMRFQLPAATDYTLSRLYIGFGTNQEMTTDDPLANINGVMVGFVSANPATHFKILHNDGGATADYDDDVAGTTQATDTAIHDLRIVADTTNSKFAVKWDNNAYVNVTTDIPAASTNLTLIFQNETNESGVAKTFRVYSGYVQTEK